MSSKKKGTLAERELLHMFFDTSKWVALRAPGSGNIPLPSPDILASNSKRYLVIECKSIKNKHKYFPDKEINDLKLFAKKFGAEPWIGMRFSRIGWYFLKIKDVPYTGKYFAVSLKLCKEKGISFEDLIKD